MQPILPPLRLTGGLALRGGVLQPRSVAVQDGRFTNGPLPAIDMTGYYLLPGIVDLQADGLERRACAGPADIAELDREAAQHGVTTRYLTLNWGWERPGAQQRAAALATAIATNRASGLTDLRAHVACDRTMVAAEEALVSLAETDTIGHVTFSDRAERASDLRLADPAGFAQLAWSNGSQPEAFAAAIDTALDTVRHVPRHLCRLAEAFDRAGLVYGSHADRSAETREHYSMIGARICHAPASAQVAAAAHAVGDPVILPAEDIVRPASAGGVPRAAALVRAGLCDALASGRVSAAPVAAAFRLADLGVLPLERAWALISTAPAEILRLPDRGVIAPGKRADLTIVNAATRTVEATVVAGGLSFATGAAAARLAPSRKAARQAAR